jgi:uncharacterized protein (UPF0276 family)
MLSLVRRVSVGIGLRDSYVTPLRALRDRSAIDVLEVMIDDAQFDARRMDDWRALGQRWPLVAHGTGLGPADARGVEERYVRRVADDLRAVGARWYSEHLCFLRAPGEAGVIELGHFAPLCLDDDELAVLQHNISSVRARWSGPLLLENPADVLALQGVGPAIAKQSGERFARALRAAEVGALLDLTNLVLQGRNDGFDPVLFLDELPWERVIEVHLAGGRQVGDLWIDTHDHPVDEQAFELLSIVATRATNLRAVIIERDDRLPPLDALLAEVERARRIVR